MEDKEFEKLCNELTEKFKNSISKEEEGLIEQLEYEGYTHEEAVYGVEQNGRRNPA